MNVNKSFWCQGGGNWFAGRNAITNYYVEAIQFNAGPAGVADNVLDTWMSSLSATALYASAVWPSATGSADDYLVGFVGNAIRGGRSGQKGEGNMPVRVYFNGNTLDLFPAYNLQEDEPGGAVLGSRLAHAVVAGNTLLAGGHGVEWKDNNTNAIVLKNDFSRAWYRALSYSGTNGAVRSMVVLKNQLGLGTSFHLKLRPPDAGGFFLWRNDFTGSNGVGAVSAFLDSAQAPVHFIH